MAMNKSGVYQIYNKKNGKRYIGSAIDLRSRINYHLSFLRRNVHSNKHLQSAWNLYGEEVFSFDVLEYVNNHEDLIEREQHYIDLLIKVGYDYNNRATAENNLGMVHDKEVREKCSMASKKAWGNPEYQQRASEQKKKMWQDLKYRNRMVEAMKNPHFSTEHRRKISESKMGSKNVLSKLNEKQVEEIIRLFKDNPNLLLGDIAKRYGIAKPTVSEIKNGKRWKHVYLKIKEGRR